MLNKKRIMAIIATLAIATSVLAGCGAKTTEDKTPAGDEKPALTGEIKIDGSSTVFPITEAVAEEFRVTNPDVKVPIGVSGTGGGFKKFTVKETDISDASRPIKDKEKDAAKENGVEYVELEVAYDGLTIVVNKENTWAEAITVEDLKKMWSAGSSVKTWKDINSAWPEEAIKFYAPGTDSGTFDYFMEAIIGEESSIRDDITPSEDDNVLVQGVAGDKNAIGFFGFSYYEENADTLKAVQIDNGNGPVAPTFDTIKDGSYSPLSRPLFIYVNTESLQRAEVKQFVTYYLNEGRELVKDVGYVRLPDAEYEAQLAKIK